MKKQITKKLFYLAIVIPLVLISCQTLTPSSNPGDAPHEEPSASMPQQSGFADKPALPNNSDIEGVQTFPDKSKYHNHVDTVTDPKGDAPPVSGEHFSAWQNCGIYDQPVGLGNALHSMEHGAVWLTYRPSLDASQISDLQAIAHGHEFVLMSPYPSQISDVILTAWNVQLVINSLPDDRIEKFIAYYENGPQNPEPGAPCSGAIGNPIQ